MLTIKRRRGCLLLRVRGLIGRATGDTDNKSRTVNALYLSMKFISILSYREREKEGNVISTISIPLLLPLSCEMFTRITVRLIRISY